MRPEILYGGGDQPLVHVPPGRVTAATVAVEDLTESDDSSTRFIVASGAATLDTYDVTLTADAGPGEASTRLFTHAGATAVVGTTYAAEAASGASELFECACSTATTIEAKGPLSGAYATGSHVRGVQLSVSFPALAASDETLFERDPPIRVTWTYTHAGTSYKVSELYRLVRNKSAQRYLGECETAMRARWPELVKMLSPRGHALRDQIKGVADRLDARLRARGLDPESLMSAGLGFEMLLQRVVLHAAQCGYYPQTRDAQLFAEEQEREFSRLWESLVVGQSTQGAADVDRLGDTASGGSAKKARSPFVIG